MPLKFPLPRCNLISFLKKFDAPDSPMRRTTDCWDVQIMQQWAVAARDAYGMRTALSRASTLSVTTEGSHKPATLQSLPGADRLRPDELWGLRVPVEVIRAPPMDSQARHTAQPARI